MPRSKRVEAAAEAVRRGWMTVELAAKACGVEPCEVRPQLRKDVMQ